MSRETRMITVNKGFMMLFGVMLLLAVGFPLAADDNDSPNSITKEIESLKSERDGYMAQQKSLNTAEANDVTRYQDEEQKKLDSRIDDLKLSKKEIADERKLQQDQLKVDVENFKAGRIAKDTETIKKIGGGLNDCEQRLKTAYTTLQNHIYHLRTPLVNLKQDPEAPDNFTFQITIEAFDKYTFEENYHLSVAPDKSAVEKSNKIKAFSQKSYICDIEYRIKVGESSDIYIVYLTKAQIRASDDTDYLQEYALNLRAKEFKAGQLINIGSGKNISAAAPVYVAPAPVVVQKPVAQVPAKQAKDPNRIGFRLYGGYMNSFTPGGNGFTISALLPLFDSNFILSGEYSSASSSYSFTSSQVTTTSDNHAGLGLGFAQPFGICMFSLSAQAAYLSTQSSIQDTTTTKYVSDVGYLGFTCGVDAGFDVRLGFLLLSLHVKGFLPSVTEASLLAGIRF